MTAPKGPGLAALRALGVFVEEDFLDAASCRELASAMTRGEKELPAELSRAGTPLIDEKVRSTKVVRVPKPLRELVRERLAAARPRVAAHFDVALSAFESPQFLRYGPNDFFQVHRDAAAEGELARRRASAVVFVNDTGFSGGALKLYGLMPGEQWRVLGLPVTPQAGLLVAFRSDLQHEVQRVVDGQRLTIVSWYLE